MRAASSEQPGKKCPRGNARSEARERREKQPVWFGISNVRTVQRDGVHIRVGTCNTIYVLGKRGKLVRAWVGGRPVHRLRPQANVMEMPRALTERS